MEKKMENEMETGIILGKAVCVQLGASTSKIGLRDWHCQACIARNRRNLFPGKGDRNQVGVRQNMSSVYNGNYKRLHEINR